MDKNYINSVSEQVFQLAEQGEGQITRSFDFEKLEKSIPLKTAANIRRIIMTGCGDSYSAAGAMKKAVSELSGITKCNTPDIIDFCYYYSDQKIFLGCKPSEVLVISISFSGGSQRVVDALARAKKAGVHALLITGKPDSVCGKAAELIFNVDLPEGCNTPGLRSYFASLSALAAIGAYIGTARGYIGEGEFERAGKDAGLYVEKFFKDIDSVNDAMFDLALKWKDLKHFEIIGDGNEGYSAQFVEQKFIECSGVYCDHTTSEEFAHISFFQRNPSGYGMVVLINKDDPSLGRMADTVRGLRCQHRPTLVVTDAEKEAFDMRNDAIDISKNFYGSAEIGYNSYENAGDISIVHTPTPPKQWMSPFVDFIPGSLLAGYYAAVNEIMFFGGRYDFRAQKWLDR